MVVGAGEKIEYWAVLLCVGWEIVSGWWILMFTSCVGGDTCYAQLLGKKITDVSERTASCVRGISRSDP